MKKILSLALAAVLFLITLPTASAATPPNVKWGGFAIAKSDYVLFVKDFASPDLAGSIAKYTPVVCLQASLNSDSSKYIYVMPFENEATQDHISGYIARTCLFFISLADYTDIIYGRRSAESVMKSPGNETTDNEFLEIDDGGQGYAYTAAETLLFISSKPDLGVRETIPANTKIMVLMQSSMNDDGLYYFILDLRNELTGFVYKDAIIR